ncbi:MAG: hypothetical protein IT393_06440 [Nitrospirae bacterium]|nr:hypothetical protein [Nitrospirota bacterium]
MAAGKFAFQINNCNNFMEIQKPGLQQIEDYLEIFLRRKWFIIIPVMVSIVGILLALILIPKIYRSSTLILIERQMIPEFYVTPTVDNDIASRLNTITQQVMSRTRLESIINEFGLYSRVKDKLTNEEIVELMRKSITLDVRSGSRGQGSSFAISYIGSEPETVMHVTNRLASLFIEENLKVREQQVEGTTNFLENELQNLKNSLEIQEMQMKTFKEKYMGELPSQLEANLRTLDRLQMERQMTNETLRVAEDRKITIESQLSEIGAAQVSRGAAATGTAPNDPMRIRLAQLQSELSQLSSTYTEKYPDIVRVKSEIDEIESMIRTGKGRETTGSGAGRNPIVSDDPRYLTLSSQLADVNAEVKTLKEKQLELSRNITLFQARVERIPQREQQISALMRDYENTRQNYQNLLTKRLDARLAESLEKKQKGEQFRILDPASLPIKPFKPNVMMIVFAGLAGGIGGGVGLALLLEYIDASFRKPDDVYTAIGIPVLASVPRIGGR